MYIYFSSIKQIIYLNGENISEKIFRTYTTCVGQRSRYGINRLSTKKGKNNILLQLSVIYTNEMFISPGRPTIFNQILNKKIAQINKYHHEKNFIATGKFKKKHVKGVIYLAATVQV